MARKWDDLDQVVEGLETASSRLLDSAQRISLQIPGAVGVYLRRLRFRKLYRSLQIRSWAETIKRPRYREKYSEALRHAVSVLGPGVGLYLCLLSMSCAGIALYLINLAEARKDAAERLLESSYY